MVVAFEKWSGAGNDFLLLGSDVVGVSSPAWVADDADGQWSSADAVDAKAWRGADSTGDAEAGRDAGATRETAGALPLAGWTGSELAKRLCPRRTAVGADGLTWLRSAGNGEFVADHWNPDGSRAEFCGNAARCVAAHLLAMLGNEKPARFRLGALTVTGQACAEGIEVSVPPPKVLEASLPSGVLSETLGPDQRFVERALWIDSGVPHAVLLLREEPSFSLEGCGGRLRSHRHFSPRGTNVDLLWPVRGEGDGQTTYRLRTYERGVEAETLACGSGALAAAAAIRTNEVAIKRCLQVRLQVRSGDRLEVVVSENAWQLRGPAVKVFEGVAELPNREGVG